jgi:hypothetical protein
MSRVSRALIVVTAVAASAMAAEWLYHRHLRNWVLTWGATAEEAAGRMPGDDLLEPADIVATRAIGIDAPPSAVWPWLVQMGPGRAGAYTYDWIENLFGLNMHSADRIVPEWQKLDVGEVLRSREGRPGMRVEILEPERVLSSRSEAGDWVWTFALAPQNGTTRLVSRNRIAMKGSSAGQRLGMLVMEPGSLVMERKMLLGIQSRAERRAADRRGARSAPLRAPAPRRTCLGRVLRPLRRGHLPDRQLATRELLADQRQLLAALLLGPFFWGGHLVAPQVPAVRACAAS